MNNIEILGVVILVLASCLLCSIVSYEVGEHWGVIEGAHGVKIIDGILIYQDMGGVSHSFTIDPKSIEFILKNPNYKEAEKAK